MTRMDLHIALRVTIKALVLITLFATWIAANYFAWSLWPHMGGSKSIIALGRISSIIALTSDISLLGIIGSNIKEKYDNWLEEAPDAKLFKSKVIEQEAGQLSLSHHASGALSTGE